MKTQERKKLTGKADTQMKMRKEPNLLTTENHQTQNK
jgi:hypothetical protein